MSRVLFHAVHYPYAEHVENLLGAMSRIAEVAPSIDGLESTGAFSDDDGGRIFAVSVWASPAAFQAGTDALFASLADVPFDAWERRPRELLVLPEVPLPPVPVV